MKRLLLILALFFLAFSKTATAQFYDNGQEQFSTRWRQIRTADFKVVFPDYFRTRAERVVTYADLLKVSGRYGFSLPANRIPILIRAQNLYSNGVVAWAPKRMELIGTPPASTFAVPWLRQLTAHEYRHVVQLSNLNQGTVKALGYLIGQQAVGAAAALMPTWFLEGDATLAETKMTSFGRGLQPDFTIAYRAMLDSKVNYRPDKWFCGSFKDYIPDYYKLGYQLTDWSYTEYGMDIWNRITRHTARYPFLLLNAKIVLCRDYNTSVTKMFKNTFADLDSFWSSLPRSENSSILIRTKLNSYTLYNDPVAINDSIFVAVADDFSDLQRIVEVNRHTGDQRTVARVNRISSRVDSDGRRLCWTEYRPSRFWQQKNHSVLCSLDLSDPKRRVRVERSDEDRLFATFTGEDSISYVVYDPRFGYAIEHRGKRTKLGDTLSVHGLAWDKTTATLAYIAMTDQGMGICALADNGMKVIKPASRVTIDNLRAGGGALYFSSIASGLDEAHMLTLADGREWRITTSRFGSKSPTPLPDGSGVILTTYSRGGYLPAYQRLDASKLVAVYYSNVPRNLANPVRRKWDVINLDTVTMTAHDVTTADSRYSIGGHLVNFHSWAPICYNPIEVADERNFNINLGVTLMSQNLLGNTFGYLNYGWVDNRYHLVRGKIEFLAFAPKIEVGFTYGGGRRVIYASSSDALSVVTERDRRQDYFSLDSKIHLPINLSSGNYNRYLTPQIEFNHSNSILSFDNPSRRDNSLQSVAATLSYVNKRHLAYRDFLPKYGYHLQIRHLRAPFSDEFGKMYSVFAKCYLPGVAPHHSLSLTAAAQCQQQSTFNYMTKVLYVRGADADFVARNLYSVNVDYQLPVAYPDGGIGSIVYFKRIRTNLFFDYSRFSLFTDNAKRPWINRFSYGTDIHIDLHPARSVKMSQLRLSLYKANDSDKPNFSLGVDIGF